jgi:DNA-binding response OmpR family regulator
VKQWEGAPQEPPHILVVCTSETVRCGLTALLASVGYAVTGCQDAWRARKQAETHRFALTILDLPISDDSGWNLVGQLRRGKWGTKLLALVDTDCARSLTPRGVDNVLVRPILVRDLLKTIEDLIGPPVSPTRGGGKPTAA